MVKALSKSKNKKTDPLESDMLFQEILHTASDAIIVLDQSQNIIVFNLHAEEIFGYSGKDAIGKPLAFLIPNRFRSFQKKSFGPYRKI